MPSLLHPRIFQVFLPSFQIKSRFLSRVQSRPTSCRCSCLCPIRTHVIVSPTAFKLNPARSCSTSGSFHHPLTSTTINSPFYNTQTTSYRTPFTISLPQVTHYSNSHSSTPIQARSFSSTSKMTQEFKLKDITSLGDFKSSTDKLEVEIEGVPDGKVLLVNLDGKVHALSPKCTHYGAPLKNGVVTPDGRLTCPWHGACFNVTSGDVEDAPAPNALQKYDVFEKEGAVYINATEAALKSGQRDPVGKCSVKSDEKVVIVGGGSGTFGVIQSLREQRYTGQITIISKEPDYVIDRTKLSKALIPDASKILWRPEEWYNEAGIEKLVDEVKAIDFTSKSISTGSGKKIPYTKLVLASGGEPRRLPLPGFKNELQNIFTLRTVADVQDILAAAGDSKKNIVVIGSSFIGMEVGNALAGKEHAVTIVGMESSPMERVMGAEVGRIFQRNLEKAGITFKLDASVEKATGSESSPNAVGAVHLKDGSVLPADLVILGVGVRPATDYLVGNPALELLKDGSVATDIHFAVNGLQNNVYAVGDIATFPYHGPGGEGTPVRIEHWNVAQNSGRSVARSILHQSRGASGSLASKKFIPIFWSALGAQLRYCGNTVNGYDDVVLQGEPENGKFVAYYSKGDVIVAVATMGVDPVMVQSAELMRRGKMPGKKEIVDGLDVLQLK